MALKLIWNNIIDEPADTIVTPASRMPRIGSGLDKIIHEVGGPALTDARRKLGTIEPGVVRVTPAFGLSKAPCRARRVIHALGPFCERDGQNGTERPLLVGCYLQILCTAVSLKAKTVSLPVMSSGKFGMPMAAAVDIAVEAIGLFLSAFPRLNVKLVGIDEEFRDYAIERYPKMTILKYDQASVSRYRQTHARGRLGDGSACGEVFSEDEQSEYFRHIKLRRDTEGKSFHQLLYEAWTRVKSRNAKLPKSGCQVGVAIDGRPVRTYWDLAALSGVSRRRIKRYMALSDATMPPRDAVTMLAAALELPLAYYKAMLISCGYSITGTSLTKRDHFILEQYSKRCSPAALNSALSAAGFKQLG